MGGSRDPEAAAQAYRDRVIAQMRPLSTAADEASVREQLSGACTTEIAAFDVFVGLLAGDAQDFDHVIFDTAPTGHTLRLLSLPKAWTGFLENIDRGASCLGPHSGLKMQEARFQAAVQALGDESQTNDAHRRCMVAGVVAVGALLLFPMSRNPHPATLNAAVGVGL